MIPTSSLVRRLAWMLLIAGFPMLVQAETSEELCAKGYDGYKARLKTDPSDEKAWEIFRVCTDKLKRWEDAKDVSLAAINKNPDLPDPYLVLGLVNIRTKRYDQAVLQLRRVVEFRHNQALPYFYLGMASLFLNKVDDSIEATEKAVALEPNNAVYHRALGYAYLKLGAMTRAETSLMKTLDIDPNDEAAYKMLAQVYGRLGRNDAMNQALDSAMKARKNTYSANPFAKRALISEAPKPTAVMTPRPGSTALPAGTIDTTMPQEDLPVESICADQWNKMKLAAQGADVEKALTYFSDYADTRTLYRQALQRLGPNLPKMFDGWGELRDCEVVYAAANCIATVKNLEGKIYDRPIRFERNTDKVWRIRSL